MIVYDLEKKRTIDAATGVYLAPVGGSQGDDFWGFTIVDGDTRIAVSGTRSAFRTGPGKYLVEYEVEGAPVPVGWPKRPGYASIIEALIKGHSEFHEQGGRTGRDVSAQVVFAPRFLERLADWEAVHGFAVADAVA